MKLNRLKELEKIADQLGIGQNREVECISCKKKINFKDAIILTNKKVVKYLCQECNNKIEKGDLNKQEQDWQKIIKEIEKKNVPYIPDETDPRKRIPGVTPWQPYYPKPYYPIGTEPYEISDIKYTVYTSSSTEIEPKILKFEPNYANPTGTTGK